MINIRPVSDLRNKFPEIEEMVVKNNEPVYLTKNGHGTMVLLSMEQYSELTDLDAAYSDYVERKLDEADAFAETSDVTYSLEEVFDRIQKRIDAKKGK